MPHWISPHDVENVRRCWAKIPGPIRHGLTAITEEIQAHGKDAGQLTIAAIKRCRSHWIGWVLFISSALIGIIGCVMPHDISLLSEVSHAGLSHSPHLLRNLAMFLSWWGDLFGFNLGVVVLIYAWSKYRRSLHWRRVAIACVLGTVFCGSIATTLRFATGRARPTSGQPPAFHGPDFRARYQSFPSGHTATAFGMAMPLAVVAPVVGVPTLIAAASISWSRMQRNQHYPSDILTSILLSICIGVPLGRAVRRQRSSGAP
ncbi:MAG: phosphatase PAP2 family protein [Verrucomicrobiales bacterium]|nr:phosphatase PAP2 family protein [Verrucomicrobiales bacterium]MCP5560067.1 phosphatase PAP2 family protein [Verrucomicrobiaceae bacterium]MCP5560969.1 phosphatase PAP2 family protein [Verrucomicrobiaceae bacterium]